VGSVAGATGREFKERKGIMVIRSYGSKRGLRVALLFALGAALQACVAARPAPAPVVDLKARSDEAQAACRAKPLVNYVARAKCLNDAAMIAAPTVENPDLFRRALNARIEIATRVDKKEITPEEGASQYADIQARLTEEGKARLANGE
jgi:hypothetical protein